MRESALSWCKGERKKWEKLHFSGEYRVTRTYLCCYLSSLFLNSIQKAVKSTCFSWDVRFKKTDLYYWIQDKYGIQLPLYWQPLPISSPWIKNNCDIARPQLSYFVKKSISLWDNVSTWLFNNLNTQIVFPWKFRGGGGRNILREASVPESLGDSKCWSKMLKIYISQTRL